MATTVHLSYFVDSAALVVAIRTDGTCTTGQETRTSRYQGVIPPLTTYVYAFLRFSGEHRTLCKTRTWPSPYTKHHQVSTHYIPHAHHTYFYPNGTTVAVAGVISLGKVSSITKCMAFTPLYLLSRRLWLDPLLPILLYMVQLPYEVTTPDSATTLTDFQSNGNVAILRDLVGADLVQLVSDFDNSCGRG